MPEIIPIHFDGSEQANGYGNKLTILLVPFIVTAVFIGLSILNNYPEIFNYPREINEENALENYTIASRMMRYLKLSLAIVFTLVTFMINLSAGGYTKNLILIIPVILGLIFLPLVFLLLSFIKINRCRLLIKTTKFNS